MSGRCGWCGELQGHGTAIADAHCAYRAATTDGIRQLARELDADQAAAADLLAHLRAISSDPDAYAIARYVLQLGWRPVVGRPAVGAAS